MNDPPNALVGLSVNATAASGFSADCWKGKSGTGRDIRRMTRDEFVEVLKEFASRNNVELVFQEQFWYELRNARLPNRRYLMRLGCTERLVFEIHYRVLCGEIVDPRKLLILLKKNFGGVMATEFFFSATQAGEKLLLFLESRVGVDSECNRNDILGILDTYWLYPLFNLPWGFPNECAANYLW